MGSVANAEDEEEQDSQNRSSGSGSGGGSGSSDSSGDGDVDGANDPEDDLMPVQLHTFSDTLFPEARPIRIYQPSRLGQGADLRVESFGDDAEVGDGVAGMSLNLLLGGTRVTDFGALEDDGVLPTLIGGPAAAVAAAAAAAADGDGEDGEDGGGDSDGGDAAHAGGGTTKVTLALYTGGRLELGLDFDSCTVVALPGRIMAVIDVVLACLMGPPKTREAQELNALEDEVEAEEAEEATGGAAGATTTIVDSRWKAIDKVRGAYLFCGRLDARFSVRVSSFSLLLPQDSRDTRTNFIMAQVCVL